MSYFPTDIPFMSDEEMRKNGIRIPDDVSDTNVGNIEYIRKKDAVDMCGGYGCLAYLMSTIKPADVAPVETLKAEIYKLKHQSEQGFGNHDYYVGYISALSIVEGILAVMDREE